MVIFVRNGRRMTLERWCEMCRPVVACPQGITQCSCPQCSPLLTRFCSCLTLASPFPFPAPPVFLFDHVCCVLAPISPLLLEPDPTSAPFARPAAAAVAPVSLFIRPQSCIALLSSSSRVPFSFFSLALRPLCCPVSFHPPPCCSAARASPRLRSSSLALSLPSLPSLYLLLQTLNVRATPPFVICPSSPSPQEDDRDDDDVIKE